MTYLDYQATTPLAPEAREAMLHWLGTEVGFANPHSPHKAGRAAAAAVEHARAQVATLFPAGGRVIFTSGATEALNLAIHGTRPQRIAASAIEHAAVLDTARAQAALTLLPVTPSGLVEPQPIAPCDLVAVMQVNNEIGTIQPVEALADAAHAAGALFLCDAVQAAGKLAPPANADMIAISAHKLHGPKGIGALWIREGLGLRDGIQLAPQIHGGGQEQGLRSGTLSPALCAGFGAAAALCKSLWKTDAQHVENLWHTARDILPDWHLNGDPTHRWHGNLNIRRDGLDPSRLMSDLRDIAFSAGSACASGSGRPSHVLTALGLTDQQAKSSIRLGFGRYTDPEKFAAALHRINQAAAAQ